MTPLPPLDPPIGLTARVRLARDYYVRVDANDYSVDRQVIGRFVDVAATPGEVVIYCAGQVVARHQRSWARHAVITDPAHRDTAATMRRALAHDRSARRAAERRHLDGHPVTLRALPDYDALFGVDFTPTPIPDPSSDSSRDSPAEEVSSS